MHESTRTGLINRCEHLEARKDDAEMQGVSREGRPTHRGAEQVFEPASTTASSYLASTRRPLPDVPLGAAFECWRLRPLAQEEFDAMGVVASTPSEAQLRYFVGFGVLAPTTHNTVPQRFRISSTSSTLEVWIDTRSVLPHSDGCGRQATISCGCVIANIGIAAAVYGWNARVEYAQATARVAPFSLTEPRHVELARLTFAPSNNPRLDRRWLTALLQRKMVRAEYDPEVELDPAVQQSMQELVSKYRGTKLHLVNDAPSLTILGKFQEMADITVYNREAFARELGQWLLTNDSASYVGMRGREFGLSDESAARLHRGLMGEERLLPDEVANLAKSANKAMRTASAVAILSVENDSTSSRLEAGQALGELSTLLQLHGYAIAMHAAVTEVDGPNMALRARLRTTHRPVVLFRIGKPARVVDGMRPHASRPPVESLLLAEP